MKPASVAIPSLIVVVAVALYYFLSVYATSRVDLTKANVHSLSGETINLAEYRGKPMMVSFWATSCGICLEETPHLVKLYQELKHTGFELIAVAMPYDPPNLVIDYTESMNIPYTVALDIKGDAVSAMGGITATPTSFLIDANGNIKQRLTGKVNFAKLKNTITEMINDTVSVL